MTPAVTAAPLAGVEVSVPLPAVPPQAWVERTTASVTVEALSEISVLPNWSSSLTTGSVVKLHARRRGGWRFRGVNKLILRARYFGERAEVGSARRYPRDR